MGPEIGGTTWVLGLALMAPLLAGVAAATLRWRPQAAAEQAWRTVRRAMAAGGVAALAAAVLLALQTGGMAGGMAGDAAPPEPWLTLTPLGAALAVLVQGLAVVIAAFSSRYLQGDAQGPAGQRRHAAALAGVLASVQVLLLANHWVLLIAAWAAVGLCLQPLLCFYSERPFARLAAHKKRLADRLADALLIAAAALAWHEAGSGHLDTVAAEVARQAAGGAVSAGLQASAVLLVLAVVLRTALLPVHGWIIQVMEAPTPVSALLHAGVVNLGGWVLIRQATLIEASPVAQGLLVGLGVATAVLAGLVMMTRISIKVRLAWSTVAQMGFMVMECGLGLYTLAALHLIGHSLYKAHAFLASSSAVQHTRQQRLRGRTMPSTWSLLAAPLLSLAVIAGVHGAIAPAAWPSWPLWWTAVLALAWAPLLWVPRSGPDASSAAQPLVAAAAGACVTAALAALATLVHALPHALALGLTDAPAGAAGWAVAAAMGLLYAALVALQRWPHRLSTWRRWSYAGFYVDEAYTRLTLRLWPTRWTPHRRADHDVWAPSCAPQGASD